MGMQRMFAVYCDLRLAEGPEFHQWDGTACLNLVDGAEWFASEARAQAKREGWVRKHSRLQNRNVDICPICWKLIKDSKVCI